MVAQVLQYISHNARTNIKKRTTDYLSVYTVELVAMILGLQWIEQRNKNNVVVASDSLSALISIRLGNHVDLTF